MGNQYHSLFFFHWTPWVWFKEGSLAPSQIWELWIQCAWPGSFASLSLFSADRLSASRFSGVLWSLGWSEPRAACPTSLTSWWLAHILAHYSRTRGRTCPLLGKPVSLILHPHARKWGTGVAGWMFFFFLFFLSGFCHTLTWISHGYTCIPHPDPPSHLPLHLIPLGLPSAPGPSTCLMHPTWAGDLFHPR